MTTPMQFQQLVAPVARYAQGGGPEKDLPFRCFRKAGADAGFGHTEGEAGELEGNFDPFVRRFAAEHVEPHFHRAGVGIGELGSMPRLRIGHSGRF